MRISDWSSDVCSSDLLRCLGRNFRILQSVRRLDLHGERRPAGFLRRAASERGGGFPVGRVFISMRRVAWIILAWALCGCSAPTGPSDARGDDIQACNTQRRSEEQTSDIKSLIRT